MLQVTTPAIRQRLMQEGRVQASLQQWLAGLITVEAVDVQAREGELRINVEYTVVRSQSRGTAAVRLDGGAP